MRGKLPLAGLSVVVVTTVATTLGGAGPLPQPPSIEGTYRLVGRDLPDGSKQRPPNVVGLITYTSQYRNFNVYVKDASGKAFSVSYIATYRLTEKEYSEKSLYHLVNDEIGGTGMRYDLSGPTGASPVSIKDSRIAVKLPLYDEPTVVFEGDKLTATLTGHFVDHWEKVK